MKPNQKSTMAAHDKLDYTKAPKPIFYPDGSIGYRQWQQRPWGTEPVAVVTYVARVPTYGRPRKPIAI
jgi:hypothetical protein